MASFLHSATVNRRAQCFHYEGAMIDWDVMLDINLRPTDDASEAFVVIYEWDRDEFTAIDLRLFRETESNSNKHQVWLDSAMSIEINGAAINPSGKFLRLVDDTIIPFIAVNGVAVFQLPDGLYRGIDIKALNEVAEHLQ